MFKLMIVINFISYFWDEYQIRANQLKGSGFPNYANVNSCVCKTDYGGEKEEGVTN